MLYLLHISVTLSLFIYLFLYLFIILIDQETESESNLFKMLSGLYLDAAKIPPFKAPKHERATRIRIAEEMFLKTLSVKL